MKLIIEIPDELANKEHWYTDKEIWTVIKAAQNATPIPDNATNICGDNRFEIIAKAKEDIISATNIEDAKDEMECLDSFLFRCWQMGWLDKYAPYQKGGKEEYFGGELYEGEFENR